MEWSERKNEREKESLKSIVFVCCYKPFFFGTAVLLQTYIKYYFKKVGHRKGGSQVLVAIIYYIVIKIFNYKKK